MSFSRKKKHPDLAYRSHEFFDSALAPPFPTRTFLQGERESRVREKEIPQAGFSKVQSQQKQSRNFVTTMQEGSNVNC